MDGLGKMDDFGKPNILTNIDYMAILVDGLEDESVEHGELRFALDSWCEKKYYMYIMNIDICVYNMY